MRSITRLSPLALCLILFACSGQGPDVVDPASNARSQSSILAIDAAGGSELAIVKEPDGVINPDAYADANGEALGRRIDGLHQSFDRLFMLHSEAGALTIVDIATRAKRAEIGGFVASPAQLCGLAFSNLAQGWVIDYNTPAVFHIDAVNLELVDSLPIEGKPTGVATLGTKVFVASEMPDGSAQVVVFQSNFTTFRIDNRYTYPNPIVFMSASGSDDAMVLVSAGAPGGKPGVHVIKGATMQQSSERTIDASDLRRYIGRVPEFAAVTRENYLYLATAEELYRIDVQSSRLTADRWLEGEHSTIGVDHWTELLYVHEPSAGTIRRFMGSGEEIAPMPVPAPVSAIEFVNSSLVY
jgi:hypothetical protein